MKYGNWYIEQNQYNYLKSFEIKFLRFNNIFPHIVIYITTWKTDRYKFYKYNYNHRQKIHISLFLVPINSLKFLAENDTDLYNMEREDNNSFKTAYLEKMNLSISSKLSTDIIIQSEYFPYTYVLLRIYSASKQKNALWY